MKRNANNPIRHTAQAYLCNNAETGKPAGACGSACGASGETPAEPKPAACGSACGAGEK